MKKQNSIIAGRNESIKKVSTSSNIEKTIENGLTAGYFNTDSKIYQTLEINEKMAELMSKVHP